MTRVAERRRCGYWGTGCQAEGSVTTRVQYRVQDHWHPCRPAHHCPEHAHDFQTNLLRPTAPVPNSTLPETTGWRVEVTT